ncbi:MAG: hypothetical protein JO033_04660 [Acidobacteriaceae bacterium]|nr:hypothetical protein [Acidobacteriaceae bacterium]MBV9500832.1 hypothetical protein [Acidobacteriaceae bacterium]
MERLKEPLERFNKWLKVIAAIPAVVVPLGGLALGYANYRHTVEHDQEQQISDTLKARPSPRTTLPNINTKPEEKPAEQQPEKEPDKPVEQPQQKAPDLIP